jgi:type IV pilus assembly protein PilM
MMPPAEVESAVQYEVRHIFPFEPEEATVRYLCAGEVRQGSDTKLEVIAVAARQQEIDGFVEQLHQAGCVIESLDFEPCALYRSVERFIRRREDETEVNALLDVGLRRSQVVIGRGREISFYKAIEIGAQDFHSAVARKLGIKVEEARAVRRRLFDGGQADEPGKTDPVRQAVYDATRSTIEDLAREVSLCLRYHSVTFRGHRPSRLRVLGGEAGDPQLVAILTSALPIPVQASRPLASVNISRMRQSDRQGHLGEWAVAFGAGLKLTRGYFGSRDGRRREVLVGAARDESASGGDRAIDTVEVVDLGSIDAAGASHATAAEPLPRRQEAAHA